MYILKYPRIYLCVYIFVCVSHSVSPAGVGSDGIWVQDEQTQATAHPRHTSVWRGRGGPDVWTGRWTCLLLVANYKRPLPIASELQMCLSDWKTDYSRHLPNASKLQVPLIYAHSSDGDSGYSTINYNRHLPNVSKLHKSNRKIRNRTTVAI